MHKRILYMIYNKYFFYNTIDCFSKSEIFSSYLVIFSWKSFSFSVLIPFFLGDSTFSEGRIPSDAGPSEDGRDLR